MIVNLFRRWSGSPLRTLSALLLTGLLAACSSSNSSAPFQATPPLGFPNSDPEVVAVVSEVNDLIENPTGFVLQVLHASDFEAGATEANNIRGFSRLLGQLKPTVPSTLTLSSGDNYIPGPFYNASADPALRDRYNGVPGKADIEILNAFGIQAAALGNHEFDQGPGQVASLIRPDAGRGYAGAAFPYLSANLTFQDDPGGIAATDIAADGQEASTIPNKIAKSAVITVNGERIGLVGATTTRLASISSPGSLIQILGGGDATSDKVSAAAIQPAVDALLGSGINKVILISHQQQIQNEYDLASELRGVDIIIGGGSHRVHGKSSDSFRPGDSSFAPSYPVLLKSVSGEPVALVNTGANSTYLGRLLVSFNAAGVLTSFDERSGAYRTDTATGTVDPAVEAALAPIETLITSKGNNIFATGRVFLNGLRGNVRTRETNLGNLTADANLERAKQSDATTVLSLKNGGGIRAAIGASGPTGGGDTDAVEFPISQLDVENALRFNNNLSLLTLTSDQIKLILESAVSQVREGSTPGGFPQVGGIAFSFDPSQTAFAATRPEGSQTFDITNPGSRVQNVCIKSTPPRLIVRDGVVVNTTDNFRLVTLNFLAGGGDNYPFPNFSATSNQVDLATGSSTFETDGAEQKALADYLTQLGEVTPANYPDPTPQEAKRIQNLATAGVVDTIETDCQ